MARNFSISSLRRNESLIPVPTWESPSWPGPSLKSIIRYMTIYPNYIQGEMRSSTGFTRKPMNCILESFRRPKPHNLINVHMGAVVKQTIVSIYLFAIDPLQSYPESRFVSPCFCINFCHQIHMTAARLWQDWRKLKRR